MAKDLTRGNPFKLLLALAVPTFIGSVFQQLYNVADTVIVGRYVGETALAAVGTTGSITGLILTLMMGATSGMSVVASQFYGAGDKETLRKTVATSAFLVLVLSVLLGVLGAVFAEPLLRLTKVPENVLPDAVTYMQIVLLGAIATGFYNMASSLLRALGDTITPLIILIVSAILNVGLNLLFVVVFNMAVAGVAIATVVASGISAIGCLIYMWIKMPELRFGKQELHLEWSIVKLVAKIGFPSALLMSTVTLGMLMIQVIVNTYGETVMAAYTVALKIESLIAFPANAVSSSMQVYTGQNMGVGDVARVKKGFKCATVLVLGYDALAVCAMLLFGKSMLGMFTSSGSQVIEVGYEYLRLIAFGLPFVGMLILSRSTLMGAGDAMIPFLMGVFELVSRLIASLLLSIPFGYVGVFWGTPLAWLTACIFGVGRYLSGKWQTKRLVKD